jgi:hypothetical protein
MKIAFRGQRIRLAITVLLTAAGAVGACTTTEVNGTDGGHGSGGSGGSGAGNGGSGGSSTGNGGSGGSSTGGSGGSSTGGSGGSGTDAASLKTCVVPPSPDGGGAPITDFSKACGGDGGANQVCFGAYPGFYGGAFNPPFATSTNSMIMDGGGGCNTFGTQSTFGVTLDTTAMTWNWTGTVGGYDGDGFYFGNCVDASGYSGIEFTLSGTLGAGASVDAGAAAQMEFSALTLENVTVDAGGACAHGSTCDPANYLFDVPAASKTIQVPWSSLTGGMPDATFDPAHITGIQWQLPWPCTATGTYTVNVTFTNVQFYK